MICWGRPVEPCVVIVERLVDIRIGKLRSDDVCLERRPIRRRRECRETWTERAGRERDRREPG